MAFLHPSGLPGLMGNSPSAGQHPLQGVFGQGPGRANQFMQHIQNNPQLMNNPQVQQIMQWLQSRPQGGGMSAMMPWLQQNPMGMPGGMGGQGMQAMQGLFGQMPTNFQFPGMTPNTGA